MIRASLIAAAAVVAVHSAHAAILVTEVAPWSSGNSTLAADWFELTNTGSSAVTITGWKMDDNSNSFASSVALNGIASIGAGESVIFIETASPAAAAATFRTLWFGASAPTGLQIGSYTGSGVGLSTGGDAVNIFDGAGNRITGIAFGTSPAGPFPTFDNAAGLGSTTLPLPIVSTLAVIGTNGAFAAAGNALEIGSPGLIAAIPEPATYVTMLAGLVGLAAARRRRV